MSTYYCVPCGVGLVGGASLRSRGIFIEAHRNCTPPIPEPVKTLRDEFAMATLTGIEADSTVDFSSMSVQAKYCYKVADAMLKEREA